MPTAYTSPGGTTSVRPAAIASTPRSTMASTAPAIASDDGRPGKAGQRSDVGRQEPALRKLRRGLCTGREAEVLEQLVAEAFVETEDDEVVSDRPRGGRSPSRRATRLS